MAELSPNSDAFRQQQQPHQPAKKPRLSKEFVGSSVIGNSDQYDSSAHSSYSCSSFETSEGSNSNTALRNEVTDPHFKILFSEGYRYNKLGVRAIQSTQLDDKGQPQTPMIVRPIMMSEYQPAELDEEDRTWNLMKQVLEEYFTGVKRRPNRWILKVPDDATRSEATFLSDLMSKYESLDRECVKAAYIIRRGFLEPVPLSHCRGRNALHAIFSVCEKYLDHQSYCNIVVDNGGGRALHYQGSVRLAKYEVDMDKVQSDEDAIRYLAEKSVPEKSKRKWPKRKVQRLTAVPDGQLVGIDDDRHFLVTSEVKSSDTDDDLVRTWLQALIGLTKSDTTYAVLLKPGQGQILEIHVKEPRKEGFHRELITRERTWGFIDSHKQEAFNYNKLAEFMEAIIGLMRKVNKLK